MENSLLAQKMEAFRQNFQENDALANYLGIKLVEVRPGYAKGILPIKEELLNGLRTTNGGAVFTLADVVFAAASNSHGIPAVSLQASISYLKPSTLGDTLTAIATEDNLTKRTGLYRIEIRNTKEELIALAQGTVFRKN
ncbi:MAG: PaaI family thioesterase [Clostridia bacterium]|nr:PaaI family thioesterase [Clostridia bacterium]